MSAIYLDLRGQCMYLAFSGRFFAEILGLSQGFPAKHIRKYRAFCTNIRILKKKKKIYIYIYESRTCLIDVTFLCADSKS